MTQVEHDLGNRLDLVAVDHFNTDRPHTQIVLRGVDDRGEHLVIAREYFAHGLRERASELVTLDLVPRTDREIEDRLRHDVDQERLTTIDRRMLRRMDANRTVSPADNDPFQQSIAAGRFRKLKAMDLAEDIGGGRYRLAGGLEDTLRRMGKRGDIIRLMQRELTARRLDRAGVEQAVTTELREPLVGRAIHRGFSDEHRDRHYLMVDGADGRVHYVDIGRGDARPPVPEGATLRIEATRAEATAADRTVDAVPAPMAAATRSTFICGTNRTRAKPARRAMTGGSKQGAVLARGRSGPRTVAGRSRRTISPRRKPSPSGSSAIGWSHSRFSRRRRSLS